jgi:hypothetical protein
MDSPSTQACPHITVNLIQMETQNETGVRF